MHEMEIGVAHAGVIKHEAAALASVANRLDHAVVAGFFVELADGAFFRGLASVDEAGGDLEGYLRWRRVSLFVRKEDGRERAYFANGGSVLLL